MLKLPEKMCDLAGSQSELVRLSVRVADPKQRHPDITLARRVLDWKPKFSFEEGLKISNNSFDALLGGGLC